MNVFCLDTYRDLKQGKGFKQERKTVSKEEAERINRELQKGYMKLLVGFEN